MMDHEARFQLPWDRFARLKTVSDSLRKSKARSVLDVGGFDGALALFLESTQIDVIDPATTGGSILNLPVADQSYDAVASIDVLEHIDPKERLTALTELARVANRTLVLNYPCRESKSAQELVLKLTGNSLIREHVEWELPDSDEVLGTLSALGFDGTITAHTSMAVWIGQFVASNLVPDISFALNSYLNRNCVEETNAKPLYHLIYCHRRGTPTQISSE